MKLLDLNGVSILWQRIKTIFAKKSETISDISRNDTTFTVTRADGSTFQFTQKDTTYNNATTSTAGLMSATDKAKLNSVENGAQENIVESVSVNGAKQTVTNKGINITVPTAVSDLNNDLGYLSEESDPTVPSWAKQAQKPVYTASEVGALPNDTVIPTKVSQLTNDSGYLTQHQDISGKANIADLAAVATSGSYNDLSNKPTIPTVPTNVSAFNNDASYADEQYVDDAIATALADVVGIEYHVCISGEYDPATLLPTLEGETGVIYLVPKPVSTIGSAIIGQSIIGKNMLAQSGSAIAGESVVYSENHPDIEDTDNNNIFNEYIYNGSYFEKIGDTSVNLSGYVRYDEIAKMSNVEHMLNELGLLDSYGTADNVIVGTALVG